MKTFQKLNQRGVAHYLIPLAILVIAGIGATGYFVYTRSSAATNYTPQKVCGSGYAVANSKALSSVGTLYTLYNKNNSTTCATVISKGAANGKSKAMKVQIGARGGAISSTDSGNFKYYAGPVYRKSSCDVRVLGEIKYGGKTHSASHSNECVGPASKNTSNQASNTKTTSSKHTPESVCGSGFKQVGSASGNMSGHAKLYVLRKGSQLCGVTLLTGSYGKKSYVSVASGSKKDAGGFSYYAGPIYTGASCNTTFKAELSGWNVQKGALASASWTNRC